MSEEEKVLKIEKGPDIGVEKREQGKKGENLEQLAGKTEMLSAKVIERGNKFRGEIKNRKPQQEIIDEFNKGEKAIEDEVKNAASLIINDNNMEEGKKIVFGGEETGINNLESKKEDIEKMTPKEIEEFFDNIKKKADLIMASNQSLLEARKNIMDLLAEMNEGIKDKGMDSNLPKTKKWQEACRKWEETNSLLNGIKNDIETNPDTKKDVLEKRRIVVEKIDKLLNVDKRGGEELADLEKEKIDLTLLYNELPEDETEKVQRENHNKEIDEKGRFNEENFKEELIAEQFNKEKIILENTRKDIKDIMESDLALLKKTTMIDSLMSKTKEMDETTNTRNADEKSELLRKERFEVENLLKDAKIEIEKNPKLGEEILEKIRYVDDKINKTRDSNKLELWNKEKTELVLQFNKLDEKNKQY